MKILAILLSLPTLALAAPLPVPEPRWISADDVRIRIAAGADKEVLGLLARGTEVVLHLPGSEYCYVNAHENMGYVACKYLSSNRIAPAKAGENGIDASQRWVSGNLVTLRAEPRQDAAIVARMGLNGVVKLLREVAGTGYCEVQPSDKPTAFTACRYLVNTPVVMAKVRNDAKDPARAFWIEPGWWAMENYANSLKAKHPELPPQGPWPRDAELEKMKAHLALGLKAPPPKPYTDWQSLKRRVAQDLDLRREASALASSGKPVPPAKWERQNDAESLAFSLQVSMALSSDQLFGDEEGGIARLVGLVRALEFAAIQPSFFGSEAEIAPFNISAEQASGRFGITYRQTVTPRPHAAQGEDSGAGLYDMRSRTASLIRPVQRVQLFRDGVLRAEASTLRLTELLWRDVDEEECAGWVPGFGSGDAEAKLWKHVGGRGGSTVPVGSLYAFYTSLQLPQMIAKHSEAPVKLNRAQTGFAKGSYLYYDLDHDGVPDLAVWEGEGIGPGHLGEIPTEDHRWYRLVLANINGSWKVLGGDSFGYGCGC